jgi:[acyl-carrier-protein] S-malonyltransferase
MQVVLLFSGQGAQRTGMCHDFATLPGGAELLQNADDILGFPLSEIMENGPSAELTRTSRCQPALYTHGLLAWKLLHDRLPQLEPVAAAGLSLGEFTAHAAAGTFSFEEGLRLVHARGTFMEEACDATSGSMAAMIGGEEDAVKALAAECDVDVANFNAPGQIVLSGTKDGIAAALAGAEAKGIRIYKELEVAGAYHSRLMRPAQEKLAARLHETTMVAPSLPVVCNVDATIVSDPAAIRSALERQVTGSVRWVESMQLLLNQGHRVFLELGPGRVIAGLMKRIDKSAVVHAIEDTASLEKAVEALSAS